MGTWICHLRVAENLLDRFPGLDEEAFVIGSLSPDSGYPNEDWTKFDPPKEVTHFIQKDENESKIRDYVFYKRRLVQPEEDPRAHSFHLAYFFHLLCDNLWSRRVGKTTLSENRQLLEDEGFNTLIEKAKADWYDLDHLYLRSHPDLHVWQIFLRAHNPPSYLDFIPLHALHHQLDYIRDYYSHPDPGRILDRPFPYLNEASMSRFIADCTFLCVDIYGLLTNGQRASIQETCLELIDPDRYSPYSAPLGDWIGMH